MLTKIQAILFDLGNTLSRSASLSEAMAEIVLSPIATDLNLTREQLLSLGKEIEKQINALNQQSFIQPDWRDVWKNSTVNPGLKFNLSQTEQLCRTHLAQYLKNCEVESYSIPLLKSLQKRGIPLVLVSNVTGPVDLFEKDFEEKGLAAFFEGTIWSSQTGYRKPDSRIFQAALDCLKQKPGKQIVMVGDNEQADILGGKEMGFTTIKVKRNEDTTTSLADYVVRGDELQDLLTSELIQ